MIDTATVELPFETILHDEVWDSLPACTPRKPDPNEKRIEGRGGSIFLQRGEGGVVRLSGSLPKFLAGHNVFGSPDLKRLVADVLIAVCRRAEVAALEDDIEAARAGEFSLSRIDIPGMLELGSRGAVRAAMLAMDGASYPRSGKVDRIKGSLYVRPTSQLYRLCIYDKHRELTSGRARHRLQSDLPQHDEILEYASTKLRVEPRLLRRYLRREGLDRGSAWSPEVVREKRQDLVDNIRVNDPGRVVPEVAKDLQGRLSGVVLSWVAGFDPKEFMADSTLYDTRRIILERVGLDILAEPPAELTDGSRVDIQAALREGRWAEPPTWSTDP